MSGSQQVELIYPDGRIQFPHLNETGVTKIGRHQSNDLVIDSPGVASFHLVLDHREEPYQLLVLTPRENTFLDGKLLPPNVSVELYGWNTIEVAGCQLVLLEDEDLSLPASTLKPVSAPELITDTPDSPETLSALKPLPDIEDPVIVTEIVEHEQVIDVGHTATYTLTVKNGGYFVANFAVRVVGPELIQPDWVKMNAAPFQFDQNDHVHLSDRDETTVTIEITPPRDALSLAGKHDLRIEVSSPTPEYRGRMSRTNISLTINPYYLFRAGPIQPERPIVSWRSRKGKRGNLKIRGAETSFALINDGNSPVRFQIEGVSDDQRTILKLSAGPKQGYERDQTQRLLQAGEDTDDANPDTNVHVQIIPIDYPTIRWRQQRYSYNVIVSPLEGDQAPQTLQGEFVAKPLIGWFWILVITIAIVLGVGYVLTPKIRTFSATPQTVRAGDAVALDWSLRQPSLFVSFSLSKSGEVIPINANDTNTNDVPSKFTTYQIEANTILTQFFPALAGKSTQDVEVEGVIPSILLFEAQPTNQGSIILSWLVIDANTVTLIEYPQDGQSKPTETVLDQPVGSMEVPLAIETIFTLRAVNDLQIDNPVRRPLRVAPPPPPPPSPPDPIPIPVVEEFVVTPKNAIAGQQIGIRWRVSAKDEESQAELLKSVTITPLSGPLPPNGEVIFEPKETTLIILTAELTGQQVITYQQVLVTPANDTPAQPETELSYQVLDFVTEKNCDVVGVNGRVLGTDNRPLAGQKLEVGEQDVTGSRFEITTDANGRYIFNFARPDKNAHTWFVVPIGDDGDPAVVPFTFSTDPEALCNNANAIQIATVNWQAIEVPKQ